MDTKVTVRYAIRETMGLIIMGVALFWSAGKMDWWPGWAALAVILAWTLATAIVILHFHPELLSERLGPRPGAKSWDTIILSLLGMAQLIRYIIAGLDQRFKWSGDVLVSAQIVALVFCTLGYALVLWATASNHYFSQIVRIQSERGHAVIQSGPYRYVRHPAYLGAIVYELAISFLLGSWWAFLFSSAGALLLMLRTALEDRALQAELTGYAEYARQVRYRLLPRIW
jgi:protein-S-isoprenylcysteine O-methyltransferase Ste14